MWKFAARTHAGLQHTKNEDCVAWTSGQTRFVVADGMGGLEEGAQASRTVCDVLVGEFQRQPLETAVAAADAALRRRELQTGSTVVAADFSWRGCRIVWVGDSRAYLWRHGGLQMLTHDHAELTPDARSVLTHAIGRKNPSSSSTFHGLGVHDWILLCTDGLTKVLEDSAIAQTLRCSESLDEAADALISNTLVGGAPDNVTVLLVDSGPFSTLGRAYHNLLGSLHGSGDGP